MLRLENTRLQNDFFSQVQSQSSSVFVPPFNPYIYNNNGGAQLENWNEYSEQAQQPMRQPVQQTVQQPMRQPVQQTVQRPMQLSPPKPMPSADVQQSPNREESQHKEHKSFSTPANFEDLKRREEKARGPAFSTPDAQQPKKPIVIVKTTQSKSRSDASAAKTKAPKRKTFQTRQRKEIQRRRQRRRTSSDAKK